MPVPRYLRAARTRLRCALPILSLHFAMTGSACCFSTARSVAGREPKVTPAAVALAISSCCCWRVKSGFPVFQGICRKGGYCVEKKTEEGQPEDVFHFYLRKKWRVATQVPPGTRPALTLVNRRLSVPHAFNKKYSLFRPLRLFYFPVQDIFSRLRPRLKVRPRSCSLAVSDSSSAISAAIAEARATFFFRRSSAVEKC